MKAGGRRKERRDGHTYPGVKGMIGVVDGAQKGAQEADVPCAPDNAWRPSLTRSTREAPGAANSTSPEW